MFVQEGNVKTYVARRPYKSNLIVGKYIVEWKNFFIPYYGKELSFQDDNFELLEVTGGRGDFLTNLKPSKFN